MKLIQGRPLEKETHSKARLIEEIDLIFRVVDGDETALEKLYHSYYSRLFRFIARITGRVDHIDDVINEVMFVVWEKAATFNNKCRLSTWIFGIAYNKALKSMRRSGFDNGESLEEIEYENSLSVSHADFTKQLEMENWLEAALTELSPEQRAVVELTYFHGMHYREISELMGCPENTIKTRMFHARKKLAPALQRLKGVAQKAD